MMRRFLSASVLGAVLIAAGLGVAHSDTGKAAADNPAPAGHADDRDRCFDPRFLRGFQTTPDDKIVIMADNNQAYELTLGGACIGLDATFMIAIRSRIPMADICGPFDAEIVYNDFGPRTCPIVSMRRLQGAEAEPYIEHRQSRAHTSSSDAQSSQ